MKNISVGLLLCFISFNSSFGSILGSWESECQNIQGATEGYLSQKPVDTFFENGSATLRIHVFEKKNCNGKEWDDMTIPCTYKVGNPIASLAKTYELDLACVMEGQNYHWYEIVELGSSAIRYGNQTGLTPEERPKKLGSIYFHRLP